MIRLLYFWGSSTRSLFQIHLHSTTRCLSLLVESGTVPVWDGPVFPIGKTLELDMSLADANVSQTLRC